MEQEEEERERWRRAWGRIRRSQGSAMGERRLEVEEEGAAAAEEEEDEDEKRRGGGRRECESGVQGDDARVDSVIGELVSGFSHGAHARHWGSRIGHTMHVSRTSDGTPYRGIGKTTTRKERR